MSDMRVLVTGSRKITPENAEYVRSVLGLFKTFHPRDRIVIVEGGAQGVDLIASMWASAEGVATEKHTADWASYGKRAGSIRNQEMVDRGATVCIAFPGPGSVGTWDCVRRARKAGIRVVEHPLAGARV